MAIKERLGHSSITVTLDQYGHLFPAIDEASRTGSTAPTAKRVADFSADSSRLEPVAELSVSRLVGL